MDPLSLTALGSVALTEGIKFLYGQAGEVLKRWWSRGDRAAGQTEASDAGPIEAPTDGIVAGALRPLELHYGALERLEGDLQTLWGALAPYAQGMRAVDPGNEPLIKTAEGLRRGLESVFQQRITFQGENRPPSGPMVRGQAEADVVAGELAGVIAETIEGGAIVEGTARAKRVESGGRVAGVDAGRIGP